MSDGLRAEVTLYVDAMENEHFTKDLMVAERKNMNIVYHISLSPVDILFREINVRKHSRGGAKTSNLARA